MVCQDSGLEVRGGEADFHALKPVAESGGGGYASRFRRKLIPSRITKIVPKSQLVGGSGTGVSVYEPSACQSSVLGADRLIS